MAALCRAAATKNAGSGASMERHAISGRHLDITMLRCSMPCMRTTLTLDDEVLRVAQAMAAARSISLGEAVSELARKGIGALQSGPRRAKGKFPTFRVRPGSKPITLDDVRRAEDGP